MNNYQKGAKKAWVIRRANGKDAPWNKGKKAPQLSGAANSNWKGGEVSYSALHHWLKRQKGKAQGCTQCGRSDGKFEWANVDGKYARKLEDYISMCKPCHRKYDERDYSLLPKIAKENPRYFNRWSGSWELKSVA